MRNLCVLTIALVYGCGTPAPTQKVKFSTEPSKSDFIVTDLGSGVIVAGKGFGDQDRYDLSVLAVVEDDRILHSLSGETPAAVNCDKLKTGVTLDVVGPTPKSITVADVSSNEANTCIGSPGSSTGLGGRDFVAVTGLRSQAVERLAPQRADAAIALAKEQAFARSGKALSDEFFLSLAAVHTWKVGPRTYEVVQLHYVPKPGCKISACEWGADLGRTGKQRAVAVFEHTGDKLTPRLLRLRVIYQQDLGPPYGEVSFVGFIAPAVGEPLAVLLWDGGPSWDFELVGPTGGGWGPLVRGGSASTI